MFVFFYIIKCYNKGSEVWNKTMQFWEGQKAEEHSCEH